MCRARRVSAVNSTYALSARARSPIDGCFSLEKRGSRQGNRVDGYTDLHCASALEWAGHTCNVVWISASSNRTPEIYFEAELRFDVNFTGAVPAEAKRHESH